MNQASHHVRRLMSLRSDPGRLSLESVLTGTALWLAVLYLMQEGAAAAALQDGPGHAGPADGGGGAAAGAMAPEQGLSGPVGSAPGPAPVPAEPGPTTADAPAGAMAAADRPDSGGGAWGGRGPLPSAAGEGASAPISSPPVAGVAGAGSLAASSDPWPGIASTGRSSGRDAGSAGAASAATGDPAVARVQGPRAASGGDAAEPAVPGLRVLVRSDDSLVSRSVEGHSRARYHQSLGAITDAVIDLRDTVTPEVLVGSERTLRLLALSVLDDAELILESGNTGLQRASLRLGPETNDIRLRVTDSIDVGLVAGGLATGQILQSLVGLLDSRLEDAGGGGTLDISTLAEVRLKVPETASQRVLDIDLLAQALQDSTVLLGNGEDRVTITSGFRRTDGAGPGLLLEIPAAGTADGGDTLQLRARALGLVNSLLDVGGGDDQVSIATWLERSWPAVLERMALLDSAVLLGDGDDRLTVEGAVIGSRLDPGGGSNVVRIDGPVKNSVMNLSPDSSTAVQLGEHDDTLALTLPDNARAEVALELGSGDDRILLPGAGLSGSIDGGGGFDGLSQTSEGATAPQTVHLDGAGSGTIGSLRFQGMEHLTLGDGEDRISVGVLGNLAGTLEAGGGLDRLDYASWLEPVHVDLSRGQASGILGGIGGIEAVAGGSGDDWFELDLSAPAGESAAPAWVVNGGEGRDRFVLAGMEAIRRMAAGGDRALPVLADVELSPVGGGGIGLTDHLAWRRGGILVEAGGEEGLVDLTPSGAEGIGQPQLLPIAPLEQLVSGMGSRAGGTEQLAIATGDLGSRLVLLGSDRSITALAELPGLRSASPVIEAIPGIMPGAASGALA